MKKLLLFSLFTLLASAMGWAATETWVKVTSKPASWDGDYLIVYEKTQVAFDGSLTSITEKNTPVSVVISNESISIDDKYCFTIKSAAKSGEFTITSKSGLQIGAKAASKVHTGTDLTNTITLKSGNAVITSVQTSGGNNALQYNSSAKRFCYYTPKSNQQPIALYKKQEGSAQQPSQVAAPTFSIKDGSKVGYGTEVTVSSAKGTNLVVSYGDVKDEQVGSNTKTIELPTEPTEDETYTISAYAVDPTGALTQSKTVTATYTLFSNKVASIKEFLVKADTENAMVFTNPVTVVYQNGKDLYVKDNTGSLLIYNSGITGLVNGDVIEAGFGGVYQLYNSLPELTKPENLVKSATAGTPVEPTVVTIDELALADYSEYVSLKKVKYDGSNFVDMNDETKKIAAYNNKYKLVTLTAGKVYNVTGIYSIYNNSVQIIPLTAKELQYVADVTVSPAFGDIAKGTIVTISCATEGAVLDGYVGETDVKGKGFPYTFTASEVGEIEVGVWATKEGYEDSEVLTGTYIVKAAVPVAYRDVIVYTDEKIFTPTTSYKTFKFSKGGAAYIVTSAITTGIQLNAKNAQDKGFPGLVMTVSKTSPSKIIITWNGETVSGRTLQIYGKNVPYSATSELYDSNKGNLIETVKYDASLTTTVELDGAYTYIGIVPSGSNAMYIDSFEFIWNEGAAGGADVTYTKASEAKAGNFAVLATADGADGKAVGRNADLNPAKVTVSGDAIGLDKSQADVDEFEIVEKDAANKTFQLCGGLSKSRRFLTYNADGGVTTTAATVTKVDGKDVVSTTDANADVTFVSTEAGLLVKFNDGQYLMFNGTKFIKAFIKADNGEAVVQADGETLTPVIVFMSSSNVSTGVETVEFDENAEAQYFNLNGVQVKAENLTPGLYIVRQGNKVSKQVIR